MKNLLDPPYQYGIIKLSKQFRCIRSRDATQTYIRVFNQTDRLFMEDAENYGQLDHRKSLKTIPTSVTNIE